MSLLARPSEVVRYVNRVTKIVPSGKTAVTRRDQTQSIFETFTPRWQGVLGIGPLDRSEAAEVVLSWLRRWAEDASLWTPIPLLDVTSGGTPTPLEVQAVSAGTVITSTAAHNLTKGEGVRIGGLLGTVVTVPSSTTFRLYPKGVAENAVAGDAIAGANEVLAYARQPAEVPEQLQGGLRLAVNFDWIERAT